MLCRNFLYKCRPIVRMNNKVGAKHYTTLEETNKQMRQVLDIASVNALGAKSTLKQILKLVQDLRQSGEPMNSETFEHMLSAYAKAGDHTKTLLIHKQMLARGIQPEKTFYNKALRVLGKGGDAKSQAKLLAQMEYFGYPKTSKIYGYTILCMRENMELERALDTLDVMKKQNIKPSATIYLDIIDMALRVKEPVVAFDLLQQLEKLHGFDMQSHVSLYLSLLRAAAYNDEYKIVLYTWDKVIECNIKPDEGLLIYILNVAGKHGDPKLATQVIKAIGENGYPYREAHFVPLIEAFVSTGDFKSTFQVFSAMRNVGVTPNKKTSLPVVYKLGKDKNAISQAVDAIKSLEKVDVSAFNLVIHSFAYNKEYDKAIALFREAEEFGVIPDSETLDATLDACIHCQDVTQGLQIYNELTSAGVKATSSTLSKMVTLMCTQEDYEDAFIYLEKMKQLDMIPLRGCYFKLIKTLSRAGDPRLSMALDDMKAYGFTLSTHITDYIERDEAYRQLQEQRNPISIM